MGTNLRYQPKNSEKNVYIQSATLNGKPLRIPVIRYDDIVAGASLKLVMGPAPSSWASGWRPAPAGSCSTDF
jgi:putative alpha-1,2-mannosidase